MKNNLRKLREEKRWTQEKLAEETGVARTIVSYLETEKDVDVKLSTLTAIAKVFNKTVSEIFLI